MITVQIKKTNHNYQIKMKGHAMFADYGKDIVCAGVSSILTTTVNAILRLDAKAIEYSHTKEGFELETKKENPTIEILLENMISLLKELEESYPKNKKVESEEER